jgi:hypothetical protein
VPASVWIHFRREARQGTYVPFSLLAAALAGLIAVPALAQAPPPDGTPTRIRGTVEKLDGSTLVVKSRDASSVTIARKAR